MGLLQGELMAKSYTIESSGRRPLHHQVIKQSKGEYLVRTSDLDIAVAHLLENTETSVLLGTCVDSQRNRWETIRINKSQLREFRKLTNH
jgi:hypothetical protein